jgi:hypothetical protein
MKNKWFLACCVLFLGFVGCVSLDNLLFADQQNQYKSAYTQQGQGSVTFRSTYTTYREVTRSRLTPGRVGTHTTSELGGGTYTPSSGGEIEYYTVREPVETDRNLPFYISRDSNIINRGNTPITLSRLDPGVTYSIVWTSAAGSRKEGTFVIPTTSPYTLNLRLD